MEGLFLPLCEQLGGAGWGVGSGAPGRKELCFLRNPPQSLCPHLDLGAATLVPVQREVQGLLPHCAGEEGPSWSRWASRRLSANWEVPLRGGGCFRPGCGGALLGPHCPEVLTGLCWRPRSQGTAARPGLMYQLLP